MISLLLETIVSYMENESLSEQISAIIADHLFVDFSEFYDVGRIANNLNSKCILFLNDSIMTDGSCSNCG